ncbi:MAG: preprotein translocase subunit SecG [Pseudomonadota bacterium]
MSTVLLVVHLLLAIALVGIVLMQKSEGGALGIGGGGGGFMTGRGTANLLTRVTAGLAAAFFATSISLTLLAQSGTRGPAALERLNQPGTSQPGAPTDGNDLQLLRPRTTTPPAQPTTPAVPRSQ